MSELKIALLGAPSVTVDERPVIVESRKAVALLFYLAITNQRQSRDWLATLFWPEQDQSRARASLRQVLWLLRNAGLEPWLVVDQDALELQGEYWCDVHHFQAALRANQIDEALTLYRADLLSGFSLRDCPEFDQWHFLQADELRRQLANALERWVERAYEAKDYEQGLRYARRWLSLDSLHEPAHRHLMRLYAHAGQHAAALRQYDECVRLLVDELGVSPEDETIALYQAIKSRQIVPAVKARPQAHVEVHAEVHSEIAGAIPSPYAPYHNLPLHLTAFVGREAELDELAKLVADPECRLVSIIGPGGIGKTRLAVQFARRFVDDPARESPSARTDLFPHGVLFVALNAVESTNGIIAAIAEAAGIGFYNNETMRQQLLEQLHPRKMLLLLDNFEHLLDSTDLIVDLLTHAPKITILVTTREVLNIQGEWLWSLGGLELPGENVPTDQLLEYAAVRLFVQSARRIQPHFSLVTEYPHVVQICRLLGGMPLAIDLAVTWLGVMSCAQVAKEIACSLNFLTTRLRDVPERHRSIYAVFEQSWRLLTPSEQETFQKLSLFRSGFDYRAAAQVAEASWLDLAALKEKSLLHVNSNGRYTVHELLRQYGAGKLEENPAKKEATLHRFCAYFADFLHQRESLLFGHGQLQAAAELFVELDNIRAFWQWTLQQGRLEEIRLGASAFYFFCQLQSRFLEGAETLEMAQHALEAMAPSPERDRTLAAIGCHQGWLYIRLGELEKATRVLQRSCDLNRQMKGGANHFVAGHPFVPLAIVHHIQGDFQRALQLATDAAVAAEARSDAQGLAFAHYSLAATKLALGNYAEAWSHAEAALASAHVIGNRWFLPYIFNESGKAWRALGDYAKAKSLHQEGYAIKREFDDPEGMAVALNHLGEIAYLQTDYAQAQKLYVDAYAMYREINDQGGLATSARGLGRVACGKGELHAAKEWFALSLSIAMKSNFWPLIYSLLLDVGQLFMQAGEEALALEVFALVQVHPASDYETKERARQQLRQWQSQLIAKDEGRDLQVKALSTTDALLQRVLTELSLAELTPVAA